MLRKFLTFFVLIGMNLLVVNLNSSRRFNKSYAMENNYQAQKNNSVTKKEFRQTQDSQKIHLYTLTNTNSLVAKITNYGQILTKLHLSDNQNKLDDEGIDSLKKTLKHNYSGGYNLNYVLNRESNKIELAATVKNLNPTISPNSQVEKIVGDFEFTEGPVWHPDGFLLFSDIPANTIYKWQPGQKTTIFRQPSGNANGNTLDRSGRLITAEHGNRRISLTKKDGQIVTLVSHYQGKRLNSPNDLAVKSDGSIYFTDPPYGIESEQEELGFYGVYRLASDGMLTLLVDNFVRPNGIVFSPDESKLYINDSQKGHIRVFDVKPDGMLTNGKLFAKLKPPSQEGAADGMEVDTKGNVYSTGPGGIWIFSPEGQLLGIIETPEAPTNLAWSDSKQQTLYITANKSIYRVCNRSFCSITDGVEDTP